MSETGNNNVLVVFWATGDLMKRKLVPALFEIFKSAPSSSPSILAVGRMGTNSEEFRSALRNSSTAPKGGYSDEFLSKIEYLSFEIEDPAAYGPLKKYAESNSGASFAFYLSIPQELFEPVTAGIGSAWLNEWNSKIAFEKPFGSDLASATALNRVVSRTFAEDQIYRIDHYVGKEAVQNVLAFRFANSIFEPLWNYRYVDHIQITASESLWVETRGGYYDRSGALRDMVQNHLFQVLALAVMEPPHGLSSVALHDEKVKVIRSLRLGSHLDSHVVFGQYRGYLDEAGVPSDSRTETFAAMKLEMHNWRFKGVPVYLRTGKALGSKNTRVVIEFKRVPPVLFNESEEAEPNRIVFEISPKEGITVGFNVKDQGGRHVVRAVRSEFFQEEESPEAYVRILSDFLSGDRTLFTRWDMIEESWALVDELVHCKDRCPILYEYEPGTAWPSAADALIEADGRRWL